MFWRLQTSFYTFIYHIHLIFISTHLNFLHHLFPEGADLCGAGNGHVLWALVLTGHAVESPRILLDVAVQVGLRTHQITAQWRMERKQLTKATSTAGFAYSWANKWVIRQTLKKWKVLYVNSKLFGYFKLNRAFCGVYQGHRHLESLSLIYSY